MNTNIVTEMEEFVKQNYSTMGLAEIVRKYGTNKSKIARIAKKFGLKVSKEAFSKICTKAFEKPPQQYNVNHLIFQDANIKEVVYILGLLWADGFISKTKTGHLVGCATTETDKEDLEKIFMKTGNWNVYISKNKSKEHPTWRRKVQFYTNNKHLFYFLNEMDYRNKTGISPDKIISYIPENLQCYWWRGFFDGDGCIYTSKNAVQIAFAGPFEQEWKFAENLMEKLKIQTYSSRQNISKKQHKSSQFRFCSKEASKKFLDYIYNGYETDCIGLSRKYQKFKYFDFSSKKRGPKNNT